MSHTRGANAIKQLMLTDREVEIVQACLLGDGSLTRSGQHYRLRIEHCAKQEAYVRWKHQELQRLCASGPSPVNAHQSFRFGTVGHPELTEMRAAWYQLGKLIPDDFQLTPFSLAVWFMDDGTRHRKTVDISAYGHRLADIERMQDHLEVLGVETTISCDSKGHRLYVLTRSYHAFKELVKPYVLPCMAYKLP